MDIKILIFLLVIGLIAGILSGVLGVGGGIVMIPLMILLLGFSQHQAQGTSLAILTIPVTLLAAYNYYEAGFVNWRYALIIGFAFLIGGWLGSKFAVSIDTLTLKRIFGGILVIIAIRMILSK